MAYTSFCLPRPLANKFLQALKDGKIVPKTLASMTSAERRDFFAGIVGKEEAAPVNALFEEKLLLKDYKRGLVTWAKRVSGISMPVRKDLVARIEKMDNILETGQEEDDFLEDLANLKLGMAVTAEEAKEIMDISIELQSLKGKWNKEQAEAALLADPMSRDAGWSSEKDRYEYGLALSDFRKHLTDLKNQNSGLTLKDIKRRPGEALKRLTYNTFGLTKSLLGSLDNSFYGRQGIKVLYTHPTVWVRDWLKSWKDIGQSLGGKDVMRIIEADILSRPNAMNGKYKAMGLDVGIDFEEAFPVTLQERVPGIGRLFKASNVAFSGGAMRMRADLADMLIPKAEQAGLSLTTGADARGAGRLINSMTGRGYIGGQTGKFLNVTFFSPKFLKSNVDTLTGHAFWQGDLSPAAKKFIRRQAALNLAKIIMSIAFLLALAKLYDPESVELDPRSTKFGKIKIGATTFDITGGMGSLVSLAARLVPTTHNGELGFWYKNARGAYRNMWDSKYGQVDAWDILLGFMSGKLSPIGGMMRDIWRGENFNREKPNVFNVAYGLLTPLPIQTAIDLWENPDSAPILLGIIADGLGISTYTPSVQFGGEPWGKALTAYETHRQLEKDEKYDEADAFEKEHQADIDRYYDLKPIKNDVDRIKREKKAIEADKDLTAAEKAAEIETLDADEKELLLEAAGVVP